MTFGSTIAGAIGKSSRPRVNVSDLHVLPSVGVIHRFYPAVEYSKSPLRMRPSEGENNPIQFLPVPRSCRNTTRHDCDSRRPHQMSALLMHSCSTVPPKSLCERRPLSPANRKMLLRLLADLPRSPLRFFFLEEATIPSANLRLCMPFVAGARHILLLPC
jgi:hypothetical protein